MSWESEQTQSRVWILLACDACDQAGLLPISKLRFHRLVYLSNCLAELYAVSPPSQKIIKYKRGPFYPEIQWELDRLSAMGLLGIKAYRVVPDQWGPWTEADYNLSDKSGDVIEFIKTTPLGAVLAEYVTELVFAFARLNFEDLDEVAEHELNYNPPNLAEGSLIMFDTVDNNRALKKTDEFSQEAPIWMGIKAREKINLYLRYIQAQA